MKQSIRAFAVGLFTAGIIMLIVNYFDSNKVKDISEMPMDDVVSQLKDKGYRIVSESEYISLSMNKDASKETAGQNVATKDEKAENKEKQDENTKADSKKQTTPPSTSKTEDTKKDANQEQKQEQEKAKTFTLKIESGMPSSTIAKELAANGIVDNADKFIDFLEKEGYAVRIQLGEFKLTSDMSYEQVAKALTR
ncbi:hypothetical protein [Ornithinibacillus bavariensis]|uniref:Endolytic transglycosylase MltG n=1 Tax=Ornithinibacillus bavariensis TaxID=545502 RepID=A0A919X7S3_9BACI|nr:hypothetical protein [Ornithinibacillus bavariensis]GIO27542.1 hypothetical protein J43TS3_21530 [Ornithinibacillus bavariensis]